MQRWNNRNYLIQSPYWIMKVVSELAINTIKCLHQCRRTPLAEMKNGIRAEATHWAGKSRYTCFLAGGLAAAYYGGWNREECSGGEISVLQKHQRSQSSPPAIAVCAPCQPPCHIFLLPSGKQQWPTCQRASRVAPHLQLVSQPCIRDVSQIEIHY